MQCWAFVLKVNSVISVMFSPEILNVASCGSIERISVEWIWVTTSWWGKMIVAPEIPPVGPVVSTTVSCSLLSSRSGPSLHRSFAPQLTSNLKLNNLTLTRCPWCQHFKAHFSWSRVGLPGWLKNYRPCDWKVEHRPAFGIQAITIILLECTHSCKKNEKCIT